ncbi:MAG TPA: hypothetical protein VGN26_14080 [Armatimonadota bacterium]|jgi:hypothetical protein
MDETTGTGVGPSAQARERILRRCGAELRSRRQHRRQKRLLVGSVAFAALLLLTDAAESRRHDQAIAAIYGPTAVAALRDTAPLEEIRKQSVELARLTRTDGAIWR